MIIGFFDGDSNPTKSLGLRQRERERMCADGDDMEAYG